MKISGSTRVFAVVGDPISHSLSPAIHNAGFKALGIDAVYVALRVRAGGLKAAIEGIKATGVAGFNLTAPHKQAVLDLLDKIDDEAESAGAANTVVVKKGKLIGFNTDVEGFNKSFQKLAGGASGRNIVVLGAGGAAGAVLRALNRADEVTILARNTLNANGVVETVHAENGRVKKLTLNNLRAALANTDVLVNATPTGLVGEKSLVPKQMLFPHLSVMDLVYKKGGTKLVRDALEKGCKAVGGEEMLLQQAMEAFKLLAEKPAPEKEMRIALEEFL